MKTLDIESLLQNCPLTDKLKKRSQLLSAMFQYIYFDDDKKPSIETISQMITSDDIFKSPCIIVTHDDLNQIFQLASLKIEESPSNKEEKE